MLGEKNKNYALYIAGVINENQYIVREEKDEFSVLDQTITSLQEAVSSGMENWIKLIESDGSLSADEKEESKNAMSWFRSKINTMLDGITELKRSTVETINRKADQVLSAMENWAGYQADAETGEITKWVDKDKQKAYEIYGNVWRYKEFQKEMKESLLARAGKAVALTAFAVIRFVILDVLSILMRTVFNTMKQIFTTEADGLKMFVNCCLALLFPFIGLFGVKAGASMFLIPAGLFYMTQLLKAIYQHATGKPYLYAD